MDPPYDSPSSKVLISSGIILAKEVNKCLWVHIEVVVKVTIPPERVRGRGKREREREREREWGRGERGEREEREREIERDDRLTDHVCIFTSCLATHLHPPQ